MLKKCPFLFILLAVGMASAATHTSTTPNQDDKGCYLISDADELYGFAKLVNAGNATACGKLDADIVVNTSVLGTNNANVNELGQLKNESTPTYSWTPIGTSGTPFHGLFDGQGHTISGLYFYQKSENFGLFGYIGGNNIDVTIKDLNISDSYFGGNVYVGSLVGHIVADGELTIENVSSGAAVYSYYNSGTGYIGGLIGYVESENGLNLSITGTHNEGLVIGYDYKGSVHNYVGGLVGGTSGLVSVTVANSFNTGNITGSSYVGGLIGGVKNPTSNTGITLNITNAYNTGTINGSSRNNIGGLVGRIEVDYSMSSVEIRNCYNYGSVDGFAITNTSTTTLGQISFTPINCYYLAEESNGFGMSANDFADGTVFALLRSGEDGEVWRQYKNDAYPTFAAKTGTDAPSPMHVATLHYSETDSVVIAYTEGTAKSLPTEDKSGNPITGWTTSADGTGDAITEIPTSATGDLKLYPKVKTFEPNAEGYYEIATADDLYKFAEIVNNGTAVGSGTELGVKAKLIADICVNACGEGESVLGTDNANVNANGDYIGSTTGLREWIPIGFGKDNENIVSFNGLFDGQGHTISGLYFNKADAQYVGLFGTLSTATIKNVGVEDSYFKGSDCIGGILGIVDIDASVNIENVYNAAVVVGGNRAGGIIGGDFGNESHVTNAYNVGMVLSGHDAGGIVGYNYSAEPTTIQNSFNYGSVSAGSGTAGALIGEVVDKDDAAGFSVSNSYYLANESSGSYGEYKTATEFADGTVLAALRDGEGGYVWVQAEGDKYPTIDIENTNAKTIVLDWTSADDSTTLADAGYTDGAMVIVKSGKQFYAGGAIYEGILSAGQVAAIGSNKLYPISGVELETDNNSKLIAILDGNSKDMLLIPTEIPVDKVVYKRDISANDAFVSIMLPFKAPLTSFRSEYTFYKFKRMAENDNGRRYVVKVSSVKDDFLANTPYITKPPQDAKQIHIVAEAEGLVLQSTIESPYEISTTTTDGVKWTMKGVYEYKTWETGDSELGKSYGFAAQNMNDVKIGEFAKLGAGASILPMRMYLVKEMPTQLARPGFANGVARINELPETIAVEFEDEEEGTMLVKRITVAPTVIKSNSWFDMKGRSLGGKPTAKGTYYHNGQKIIIK